MKTTKKSVKITYQCEGNNRMVRYVVVNDERIGKIIRNDAVACGDYAAFSVLMTDGFRQTSTTLKGAKSIVAQHIEK